ncbi:N-acetyltransferase [Hymenobacter sp.]|uniref:GNAT family N-acetyltransferase n=1 Tax=Hymenobacter sp. TaxID=1898978 RepID=UPI00286D04DA|nr:N-acetyltransferase [Hymenobacter sp.]
MQNVINHNIVVKLTMAITIRPEQAADINTITRLTEAAFQPEPYASHTEHLIVNALRRSNQLTVSLVAVEGDTIMGHVAISPVTISSGATGWYGLGPISVWPERQHQGIGSKLMAAALAALQHQGGLGCVLLGSPAYYGRFGFRAQPGLLLPDTPPEFFQAIAFGGELPVGNVRFHEAFDVTE